MTGAAAEASRAWNAMMMAADRDYPAATPPRVRYAILSVPRSGSTLLARALGASRRYGDPHEYLNPNAIDAWKAGRAVSEAFDLATYLSEIERRRTSPEGYFGIKVHFRHFTLAYGDRAFAAAADFVARQDRLIFIRRRDQVAQAVSYHAARSTGRWTSEHEPFFGPAPVSAVPFDVPALDACLDEVVRGEANWRSVLAACGSPFLEIDYEDLVGDYEATVATALRWLGASAPVVPPLPTRPSRIGADGLLDRYRRLRASGTIAAGGG
ncbi:MAG: hypothetical protein KIS96_09235 [Bauldia sp.]|nr:hypothetical protein [Bauldia sp.]